MAKKAKKSTRKPSAAFMKPMTPSASLGEVVGTKPLPRTEVTKKLAGWAAIIAVPTMIAGIYGMNFKNMPELDWAWGYPVSVAVMVVIDIWLYLQFKKIKWL